MDGLMGSDACPRSAMAHVAVASCRLSLVRRLDIIRMYIGLCGIPIRRIYSRAGRAGSTGEVEGG